MIDITINPYLFQWGGLIVSWHGLFLAAAAIVVYRIFLHSGRRAGFSNADLSDFALWLILFVIVGARGLSVLENWRFYAAEPLQILDIRMGGLSVFGSVVTSIMAVILYSRWKGLNFWKLIDSLAFAAPFAMIVGCMGCNIAGDIWGEATHEGWGVVYWHSNAALPAALHGVPTVPIPFFLQLLGVGLFILLSIVRQRTSKPGVLFATFLSAYSTGRLIINGWDGQANVWLNLNQTQVFALVLCSIGILLLLYLQRTPVTDSSQINLQEVGSDQFKLRKL